MSEITTVQCPGCGQYIDAEFGEPGLCWECCSAYNWVPDPDENGALYLEWI